MGMRRKPPDIVDVEFEELEYVDPATTMCIQVNTETLDLLDLLVSTGFFGATESEAASILLRERIRELAWPYIFHPPLLNRPFPFPPPPIPPMPMPPVPPPMTRRKKRRSPRPPRTSSR